MAETEDEAVRRLLDECLGPDFEPDQQDEQDVAIVTEMATTLASLGADDDDMARSCRLSIAAAVMRIVQRRPLPLCTDCGHLVMEHRREVRWSLDDLDRPIIPTECQVTCMRPCPKYQTAQEWLRRSLGEDDWLNLG